MAPKQNRQIVLKNRPQGMPTVENFAVVETPVPSAMPGQVLRQTIYLSLDPYIARADERCAVLCPAGGGRAGDGWRNGEPRDRIQ